MGKSGIDVNINIVKRGAMATYRPFLIAAPREIDGSLQNYFICMLCVCACKCILTLKIDN